ncbi:N-acetylneuraminate synthase family protein [Treponema zioleckii]|uniref:N-acetylneuraminate synthase family protein n=1 Tax=Treponema zioleckii TaxID=331680 RepID=UPI00168B448E|nr:N-acetylneuraminate synthase family protein [Treponema zioleckii]
MQIVAEIGTSHGGDFEKAKKLIDTSIDSGADFVKFQWVYADEILHPETGFVNLPGGKIRLYDRFKELEVPKEFFADCQNYIHSKNAKFMCSPFGLKSLKELIEINPDCIKIASPELNHLPLLKELAEYRKNFKIPVVVSSGVSKLRDIENALSILGTDGVTLLHCITFYPAPEEEYNLNLIPNLSKIFGVPCGVSDHSLDPVLVPSLAAAVGGEMIEKHITLSRKTDGLDDPVALEGEQFALMTHCIRQCEAVFRQYGKENGKDYIIRQLKEEYEDRVEKCLGNGIKKLAPAEEANYGRTNRSLHFMHSMKAGEIVQIKDIGVLRTEKILTPGISPEFLDEVIGKRLTKEVKSGEGVLFTHFFTD